MPVACEPVPCLPNIECQDDLPIIDDDDIVSPAPPPPAATPAPCEPVYIYVFDDDEYGQPNEPEQRYEPDDSSSISSTLVINSLFVIMIAIISLFIQINHSTYLV
eukprot:TRINITY_DN7049_c1_g1_i1.p4 TRINITY_DN7049_c1_g1~~TRINITY_DN7049_c1_g1_i1.p4  ORF type:complete len:105 (-),score=3.15 TRINITY_DN7049_c1_g1_i1:55-369(-)